MVSTLVLAAAALLSPKDPACADPVNAGMDGASRPVSIGRTKPDYPSDARGKRLEGRVTLSLLVCRDGRVHDVVRVTGVPWARSLDESAERAARQWTFRPAVKDGRPVASWMVHSVGFELDKKSQPAWWDMEAKLGFHETTLDKALAAFEKVGLSVEYTGSAPPIHASYQGMRVQTVLDDLVKNYGLEIQLVAPNRLRVTALPGADGEGIVPPVLESKTEPEVAEGIHGTVGLNLVVLADGTVDVGAVVRPSGNEELDRAARRAVRQWRYRPATAGGRPVAVYVPVTVDR